MKPRNRAHGAVPTGNAAVHALTRRQFLQQVGSAGAAVVVSPGVLGSAEPHYKAAIIGHTGQGNYGHEHDLIFGGRKNVEVVAVADPDREGRAKAAARSRAARQYEDYRQMLEKEKPGLVAVTPRWTDRHHAMMRATLHVGAHVYVEKPFTTTLAEADDVLKLAKSLGRKVVVAHQMRLAPNILALKPAMDNGLIGELLEIRAHGKQDSRAGGEDLIVLGVHLFDLMRLFGGDAAWCSARVLQDGHEITLQDARPATEGIGLVAGNDVVAQYGFSRGVHGSFVSRRQYREAAGPWGLELIGSKALVKIQTEMIPRIFVSESDSWTDRGKTEAWRPWRDDPTIGLSASERGFASANRRVVDDWLTSIENDIEPVCSGHAAMRALEMAHAVFAAGLSKGRAEIPLRDREHPLRPR